ncbi:MAG TPA: class I SAM-dependent methyltransferase [Opitutaceae bacterium]|jgi:ubiquinone/menaquinone biosynthesis C-methylase UbiE|nr:class I SAM-dependent methyltransferase [Opitutaceae bacterium]
MSFDRLAKWYRFTEFLAFGGDLERTRFEYLGRLAGCRDVLLLGEGDGRCAERLALLLPNARITCVDSSLGMIERAASRISAAGASDRVKFEYADIFEFSPGRKFDAVATFFFLDCFTPEQVSQIVSRTSAALKPGAVWLFSDFVIPAKGFPRFRARFWLKCLYTFFRWETGLPITTLPPSEEILVGSGWFRTAYLDRQGGMLRSAVFQRAPTIKAGAA